MFMNFSLPISSFYGSVCALSAGRMW